MTRVNLLPLAVLCLFSFALGCAPNSPVPARVSGSISYKGQPIKSGAMAFHTADGNSFNAVISSDGTYTASDLPVGEMVITVNTEVNNTKAAQGGDARRRNRMQTGASAGPEAPPEPAVKIPAKYRSAKTSPLTVTLHAGRKVHNVDLTD
jgi:hypothetical protein